MLLRVCPVGTGVVAIQVHLAHVGRAKGIKLEIDAHQAPQPAVQEHQIDPVPGLAHTQPALTADAGEISAQFEEKALQLADEGFLQVRLGVCVVQVEACQDEWALMSSSGVTRSSGRDRRPRVSITAWLRDSGVRSLHRRTFWQLDLHNPHGLSQLAASQTYVSDGLCVSHPGDLT
jgi:hypothetical protein